MNSRDPIADTDTIRIPEDGETSVIEAAKIWIPPTVTHLNQIDVAGGSTSNQLESTGGGILGS